MLQKLRWSLVAIVADSVTNRKLDSSFPSSTELTIHHITTRMNQALRAHYYNHNIPQCSHCRSAPRAMLWRYYSSYLEKFSEPPNPALAKAIRIENV